MQRIAKACALLLCWPLLLMAAVLAISCSDAREQKPAEPSSLDLDSSQIEHALRETLEMIDTLDRVSRTIEILESVHEDNLEGVLAAYEARLAVVDRLEIRLLANAWARLDPQGALERIVSWKYPGLQREAVSEVVYYWARHGGASEARAYAEALQPDRSDGDVRTVRNVAVDAVARALAASGDYDELTRFLAGLPNDTDREWLLTRSVFELYRVRGPDAAKSWIDSIPPDAGDGLFFSAYKRGLDLHSKNLGAVAGAWYEEREADLDPLEVSEALPLAVRAWTDRDPEAAIQWLLARPESQTKAALLRTGAVSWLKSDPEQAASWIEARLEDELIKDRMLFPLTQYKMSVDIHAALPMAHEIPREGERIRALKQILVMWSRRDREAVEAYLVETELPPDVEATVRGQMAIQYKQQPSPTVEEQGP